MINISKMMERNGKRQKREKNLGQESFERNFYKK
jgi:hypothetical protein